MCPVSKIHLQPVNRKLKWVMHEIRTQDTTHKYISAYTIQTFPKVSEFRLLKNNVDLWAKLKPRSVAHLDSCLDRLNSIVSVYFKKLGISLTETKS